MITKKELETYDQIEKKIADSRPDRCCENCWKRAIRAFYKIE